MAARCGGYFMVVGSFAVGGVFSVSHKRSGFAWFPTGACFRGLCGRADANQSKLFPTGVAPERCNLGRLAANIQFGSAFVGVHIATVGLACGVGVLPADDFEEATGRCIAANYSGEKENLGTEE